MHPYINIFGGGAEEVTEMFSNFHRTVEVTQDSWIARKFFGRADIFTGTSWTAYIDKAEGMKERLDGSYRNAYQRIYHSQPPEGFITDSVGVMKDLVADEAFDNELYSVRMPLIWLSGVLPLALGGFLPSLLWSFPLSPYAWLTGMRSLTDTDSDEALYKLLVLDDLKDILKNKVKKETSDAIFNALSKEDKDKILKEEVKTMDEARRILGALAPELRRKILDAIDREGIKTSSILGMSISTSYFSDSLNLIDISVPTSPLISKEPSGCM